MIDVHVVEEAIKLFAGYGQAGGLEGGVELRPVELSVAIFVYRPEEGGKFSVRTLNKALKLCIGLVHSGLSGCLGCKTLLVLPWYWILPSPLLSTSFRIFLTIESAFFIAIKFGKKSSQHLFSLALHWNARGSRWSSRRKPRCRPL